MSGPRRLMDDPDFLWETGCDLRDEALLHVDADLSSLKASVLSDISASPAATLTSGGGSVSLSGVLGTGTAVVLALGVGYWLGVSTPSPDPVPAEIIEAPATSMPVPVAEDLVPAPTHDVERAAPEPVAAPPIVAAEVAPSPATVRRPSVAEPAPEQPPSPIVAAPELEEGDGVVALDEGRPLVDAEPPARRSGLDAEVDLYDSAAGLRNAGEHTRAIVAYQRYLQKYPSGHLAREARLSMLECYLETAAHAEAVDLAAALVSDPGFTDRRRELLLVQAESLVRLDRCLDALAILDSRGARDARAMAVRRECRRRH